MAKINLVSLGHHHDHFWKLAKSLRSRSMDIRLWISRYNDSDDAQNGLNDIEILTPFKKRSLKEVTQSLIRLTALPTEIFHVHCGSHMDLCDHLFYQFLKTIPQHRVILHLSDALTYNIRNNVFNQLSLNQLNRLRFWEKLTTFFCYGTNAITVENYTQLVWLHQSMRKKQNTHRMILPPLIQTHQNPHLQQPTQSIYFDRVTARTNSEKIQSLCAPLTEKSLNSRDIDILKCLHKHFGLFLFGDFENMQEQTLKEFRKIFRDNQKIHRFPFHFHQWDHKTRLPLAGRSALFTAGLDLPTQMSAAIIEQALILKKPLILDTEQAMIYSGLWSHGKNCLIYDRREVIKHPRHLIQKLNEVPQHFFEQSELTFNHQSLDQAVNELSRVYQTVVT